MRIIAGRHRGRSILGPASATTRPITDRAKQSLFDILAPRIDRAVVYDLFAGTGSMGLECLSRGAAAVTFFERDRSALVRLRKNLATLGEQKSAAIIDADIFRRFAEPRRADSPAKQKTADIIFLDPPYRYVRENTAGLQSLAHCLATDHLQPTGLLIFRHERRDALGLPGLQPFDQRIYGSMAIDLFQPIAMPADESLA
ncbi:MAG TPA: 16S rRNA (guanine(966)-N(2))-methyltransferase RsmD [Tepidisphaeraceae bacterium]|jgi:16S rRNA (guanine966-N2)-methyltransferase|nr:16S rRNA (guanine(966)-N(2))-methyltransferase RsmD [Tepidisphaeraceae bacterium]